MEININGAWVSLPRLPLGCGVQVTGIPGQREGGNRKQGEQEAKGKRQERGFWGREGDRRVTPAVAVTVPLRSRVP
eukprot:1614823-Rhodomonas_salina.1